MENRLLFNESKLLAVGEMNGTFFCPGWTTLDLIDADILCDMRQQTLLFPDESLGAIYCSHVIEHISIKEARKLLKEFHRVLKPGAICRIVTPDMQQMIDHYRDNDWMFFIKSVGEDIYRRILADILPPESILIHNLLLNAFASYSGRLDTGGGPICEKINVDQKLASTDIYGFRDWSVSLLKPGRIYAHVHVYDRDELCTELDYAGFKNIEQTEFLQSRDAVFRTPRLENKKRALFSLYIDAAKPGRP